MAFQDYQSKASVVNGPSKVFAELEDGASIRVNEALDDAKRQITVSTGECHLMNRALSAIKPIDTVQDRTL